MALTTTTPPTRWTREPMAWFVFALPATVVVAGVITAFIAWRGHDGAVADDTYRQGLAIGERMARSDTARRLGLSVSAIGAPVDGAPITISLRAADVIPDEPRLELRWIHPARSGADRQALLVRTSRSADGRAAEYVGRISDSEPITGAPAWRYVLSSPTWRVDGDIGRH